LRENGEGAHPAEARLALWKLMESFCRAQYEEGDWARPHTGEFYRGDDARWLTGERDYNHSTWADLVVSALVGLVPRDDETLEVHPLLPAGPGGRACVWEHFCLDDLPYRGRTLTIVWDDPTAAEDHYDDGDKGLTVYADGQRLHHQNDLSPFRVGLPVRFGDVDPYRAR
jgi:hypothetical protein